MRRRLFPEKGPRVLHLSDVQARLEHYLLATYGMGMRVVPVDNRTVGATLHRRALQYLQPAPSRIATDPDAVAIRLPATLPLRTDEPVDALARYRVLAVQQAERLVRDSAGHEQSTDALLLHDLFLLRESVNVDHGIVASQPGLRAALEAGRLSALAQRPKSIGLTPIERRVEHLVVTALSTPLDLRGHAEESGDDAAAWARRRATEIEAEVRRAEKKPRALIYRGLSPIGMWGTPVDAARRRDVPLIPQMASANASLIASVVGERRKREMESGSIAEQGSDSESAQVADQSGSSDGSPDASTERSADTSGDGGAPTGAAHGARRARPAASVERFEYPEWDAYADAYRPESVIVYAPDPPTVSAAWADRALVEHAALVRRTRQQFERLQSRREHLKRQASGDEIDLDACVESLIDRRMGRTPDDRLYSAVRPGRRELAIAVLADVSGSTEDVVFDTQRVIDIERLALLLAAEALDALGDRHAMYAFSSDGAADVRVFPVKRFGERNSPVIRQRVSALVPHGKTRLGAAIRHGASQLARQAAPHRLLLVLSDGKPNDRDRYFVGYGVADSRRAVMEARLAGVHAYCITVDRDEPGAYLADIFGEGGYLALRHPEQLPRALVRSVERMLSS